MDLVAEATLHGRRETTYLVLAAMVFVAMASLILFEPSRVIDVSAVFPDLHLPIAALVPVGVLPFALSFVAIILICELYGSRRATALVWVGLLATVALLGLMRGADLVDRRATFTSSFAFAGGSAVAQLCYLTVFEVMRRRARGGHLWLRLNVSMVVAQVAGWATFGAIHIGHARWVGGELQTSTLTALAIGSAAYTVVCMLVLTIPVMIAARSLALFLRVDRAVHAETVSEQPRSAPPRATPRLPPALIIEGDDAEPELPRRRRVRASIQPFSSAEMQFFADGDQLAD